MKTRNALLLSTGLTLSVACSSDERIQIERPVSLAVPVVTEPAADAIISSPVTVRGTGATGAEVTIVVLAGTDELGRATTTVDANKAFSAVVGYGAPVAAATLTCPCGASMFLINLPITASSGSMNVTV